MGAILIHGGNIDIQWRQYCLVREIARFSECHVTRFRPITCTHFQTRYNNNIYTDSECCGTTGSSSCACQLYLTVLRLRLFCDHRNCGTTPQANHNFHDLSVTSVKFPDFSRFPGEWQPYHCHCLSAKAVCTPVDTQTITLYKPQIHSETDFFQFLRSYNLE